MGKAVCGYRPEVRRMLAAEAIADILEPYAQVARARPADRPWVMANMVAGLDGSAAFGGRVGPLSGGADAELFRLMRAVADVVLVGAATVRAEGYGPVKLPEDRRAARLAEGRPAVPALAVVTRSLDLDWSSSAFGDDAIVLTAEQVERDRLEAASRAAEVCQVGERSVDLAAALRWLGDRGHDVVLCEGGPTLLGELVDSDLLDELCLTVAPIMGGDQLPVAITSAAVDVRHFTLRHTAVDGNALFLRYERERPDGR